VSKGFDADIPGKPFGGDEDFAFSPDGKSLVFSARHRRPHRALVDQLRSVPDAVDGSAAPANLTASNPAWDAQPVFLASGDLAWLAQERPGFEADRFHIVLKDAHTGAVRSLTGGWIVRSRASARRPMARRCWRASRSRARRRCTGSTQRPVRAPGSLPAARGRVHGDPRARGVARADLGGPDDLYVVGLRGGPATRVTDVNHELLAARRMGEFEQFSFKGWSDETVYGYVVKPYGFAPGQHFPVAFVVHGGPQVSFGTCGPTAGTRRPSPAAATRW